MSELISVIIPMYNVENYLARCLESVCHQTYENLEIILVDDGSPDDSISIARKYAQSDSRIKIYRQENAGLSEARNTGVRNATGDFIAFLDSDDWLELDAYEYLRSELIKHEADIVVGAIRRTSVQVFDSKQKPIAVTVFNQKEYMKKYFKINSQTIEYYVWNKLYRREVIENTEQPKGLYAEDVPSTCMYLLRARKIVSSNKIVYNYFINQEGLSAQFSKKHFDVLKGWDMVVNMVEDSGDQDYISWANFNRQRVNFSLLTEIAISKNYSQIKSESSDIIYDLLESVRRNFKDLILGPMPVNRKLLLISFSCSYDLTAYFLNKLVLLLRKE